MSAVWPKKLKWHNLWLIYQMQIASLCSKSMICLMLRVLCALTAWDKNINAFISQANRSHIHWLLTSHRRYYLCCAIIPLHINIIPSPETFYMPYAVPAQNNREEIEKKNKSIWTKAKMKKSPLKPKIWVIFAYKFNDTFASSAHAISVWTECKDGREFK